MPFKTFLLELQSRPDGIVNSSVTSYSTLETTLATYHQRYAAALGSTQFMGVYLQVMDNEGTVYESAFVNTQYVPPEPEGEGE